MIIATSLLAAIVLIVLSGAYLVLATLGERPRWAHTAATYATVIAVFALWNNQITITF